MKVIIHNKRPAELEQIKNQLATNGFDVVGSTNSMDRLLEMANEHGSSIGLLRPEIMCFMRTKEELEKNDEGSNHQQADLKPSLKVFLDRGQKPLISEELWRAAVGLANERYEPGLASVHAGICMQEHCLRLPTGYESLPTVWHVALPGLVQYLLASAWSDKSFLFIDKLSVNEGVLDIGFLCEDIINEHSINKLRNATRIFLNRHLYPNRWTPLLPQHQVELHNERMDLREEIERVHGNMQPESISSNNGMRNINTI
jgi:hypothetical protein